MYITINLEFLKDICKSSLYKEIIGFVKYPTIINSLREYMASKGNYFNSNFPFESLVIFPIMFDGTINGYVVLAHSKEYYFD